MRSSQQKNHGTPEWFGLDGTLIPIKGVAPGVRKPEEERSQEAKEDVSSALTMPGCAEANRTLPFLPLEVKDELKEETEQLLGSWRHSFDENE